MIAKQNRYRWMTILMISSQLLLTGFVLYWLRGQYREEKLKLNDRLNHEYQLVQDQLLDSMLLKTLIIPSLDDSMIISLNLETFPGPESSGDTGVNTVMKNRVITRRVDDDSVTIGDSGLMFNNSTVWNPHLSNPAGTEERMVRGIKIFIDQNNALFSGDTGIHVLALMNDSAAIMEQMGIVLDENACKFRLDWAGAGQSLKADGRSPGILVTGGGDAHLPVIRAEQVRGTLVLSILPQILFGLTLLLLSFSALMVARTSLKKQIALHRLRDDFIGNIGHELKTPVSTVKIALEALRKYDLNRDPGKTDEYLDMAASELERLEKLVGKVLHHEMLRNPSLVLQKEPCELGAMVKKVLRTMDLTIRDAGATVEISGNEDGCVVDVDPVYMEGVIMNLIDNSLKYGGERPEIEIRISCDSSGASLSVKDNGDGIPEEYRDQVFEKFFRVPAGDKHNVKGYGLGLNFASLVMARHGGSISLSDHSGGGALFTLHFPGRSK
jgi:signal transduction histidine kinase